MQITINIPDKIYHSIEKIDTDIESSVLHALEFYAERKRILENDPFIKWLNTPVRDKENKTDVSENHDKYIYNL